MQFTVRVKINEWYYETMKVYIAARFKGAENKPEIESLCAAVKAAGMKDFCFIRDVENYQHTFDDPQELWQRAYDEILACDAFLIDVSDNPTGGRMVEAGIAYALKKRVFVVVKKGVKYKGLFDGISWTVIEYETHKDLAKSLKKYDEEVNFSLTDKTMMLGLLLCGGVAIGWVVSQLFIPLGIVATVAYWLILRMVFKSLRVYDRLMIYVPLAAVWLWGISLLFAVNTMLAWAYAITFWVVAIIVLQKSKFAL